MIHICFKTSPFSQGYASAASPRTWTLALPTATELMRLSTISRQSGGTHQKLGSQNGVFFLNHIFDYIFVGVFCAFVFIYIYVYIVLVFFNHLL